MSRNSSGTYSQPTGTSAVSGATIDPTAFNTLVSDLGSELTNSLDRSGRGAMTAALNLGGFKAYNAADPSSSSDLATKNYVDTAVAGATPSLTAYMQKANNLSDVSSVSSARSNLGLADSATTSVASIVATARQIPQNAQSAGYTLTSGDGGGHVSITTGGVTVPSGVLSVGQAVTVFNNSASSQTITQGTSVTLYQAGTANTGNRTLAQRGLCTILCVASNVFVISGAGLS